jgi:hypothetical protein
MGKEIKINFMTNQKLDFKIYNLQALSDSELIQLNGGWLKKAWDILQKIGAFEALDDAIDGAIDGFNEGYTRGKGGSRGHGAGGSW